MATASEDQGHLPMAPTPCREFTLKVRLELPLTLKEDEDHDRTSGP